MTTPIYHTFITKSNTIHNYLYKYPNPSVYVNKSTPIPILCKIHGRFNQTPKSHLLGRGCPKCANNIRKTTESFTLDARNIHGDTYNYDMVEYKSNKKHITIACKIHGEFSQSPKSHLLGRGCSKCSKKKIKPILPNNLFILRCVKEHSDFYNYSETIYKGLKIKMDIICPLHGKFIQLAGNHMRGSECPSCSSRSYSKVSIHWLDSIGIDIQHAENGGEYKIYKENGTFYRADGYCKNTNTIYEFHGDSFHGNPKLYTPNGKCHPFNKEMTAGELYLKTIERENEIKSLGYNLVVMWEDDYRSNL